MALCPFADKGYLIRPGSSDPRITPRVAILHTDGGNVENLGPYFKSASGGIESHFHIRKDGHLYQYRNTEYEADANYLANPFAISIETQGTGYEEWTPAQVEMILRLLRWLNTAHSIPLRECKEWNGSGVGYHIKFGSPGKWTNVSKICPGPKRIEQYNKVILPALAGKDIEEDDMPTPAEFWNFKFEDTSARTILTQARENAKGARIASNENARALVAVDQNQDRLARAVSALAERLEQVAPGIAQDVVDALGERVEVHVVIRDDDPTEETA